MSDEILELTVDIYQTIELSTEKGSVDATVEISTNNEFEVTL